MSLWKRLFSRQPPAQQWSIIQVNPYLQIRHPLAPQGDQNDPTIPLDTAGGCKYRAACQAPHSSPNNPGAGSPQGPGGAPAGGYSNAYTTLSGGTVYSLAGQGQLAQQANQPTQTYIAQYYQGPQSQYQGLSQMGSVALGPGYQPASNPVVPAGDLKVGEIVGWRSWKVGYEPGGLRLRSLYWDTLWVPGQSMTGRPWANSEGIYAWKNKDAAEGYGNLAILGSAGIEGRAQIILGQVDLWGVVDEYTDGYRAEYGSIKSLNTVLGEQKGDDLLETLREIYGVKG